MDFKLLDDEQLLHQIVRKQHGALAELYDRFGRLVFTVAMHGLNDTVLAEDVTQEVFLQVWRNAAQYSPTKAKVSTWLTSIARYRSIDRLRRQQARGIPQQIPWTAAELIVSGDDSLEMIVNSRLEQARVRGAMETLPVEQQQVLALAYFQGYSQSEIAALLDLPLGTVKTRVRLGMEKLRHLLSDD